MSGSSGYLLAVDVGNSRIKCGLFANPHGPPQPDRLPVCLHSTAVPIKADIPWETVDRWLDGQTDGIDGGIIAGANPDGTRKVIDCWRDSGRNNFRSVPAPLVVEDPGQLPLPVNLPAPERVGVDRLLNAVAANVVRPAGREAVIVDIGTATTVDFVSADGAFEGGAILPGFELSARALQHYTALLPLIDVEELQDPPPTPLGRDTREALRSGLFWGQLGAVKELLGRLSDSGGRVAGPESSWPRSNLRSVPAADGATLTPRHPTPCLLLTGGGSDLLKPLLPDANWLPALALQGLAVVAAEWKR